MIYSFTGPSKLTQEERARAQAVVGHLDGPTEIRTGGAYGWDTTVAFHAVRTWPGCRHVIVVPAAAFNHAGVVALVALAARLGIDVEVLQAPAGATAAESYRTRNELMVGPSDRLVAGLHDLAFYRSGEWMTVNIAKRAGIPVEYVDLGAGQVVR